MKKVVVIMILLLVTVMLVGCLDYKAYDTDNSEDSAVSEDDDSLLKEIEKIEKELEADVAVNQEEIDSTNAMEAEESTKEVDSETVDGVVVPELIEETTAEPVDNGVHVVNVKENEMVKLNVAVQDPDEDPVTITYGKPLDNAGQWKTN